MAAVTDFLPALPANPLPPPSWSNRLIVGILTCKTFCFVVSKLPQFLTNNDKKIKVSPFVAVVVGDSLAAIAGN